MTDKPIIQAFFDGPTFSVSYVVSCPSTKECAVIDAVLGYNAVSGHLETEFADQIINYVHKNELKTKWIMDTHVHADHLTAADYLKEKLGGGSIAIGAHIPTIQQTFAPIYNVSKDVALDGSQFDHLFEDSEAFSVGHIKSSILHTPGHTPACISVLIGDAIFVGDTLFMPDFGTARCDFPGGDAKQLYQSIQKILTLPDETRLFVGHDYRAPGRNEFAWETTIGQQKSENKHLVDQDEASFVEMRERRDEELDLPKLIIPAIQVNMNAGQLPKEEDNGIRYIKIPMNTF